MLHRAGSRRIVVAGGDGSLHAVVSALHRRHELAGRRRSALLPLGTGNDFARGDRTSRSRSRTPRGSCVEGEVRPVDLIVDEVGEIVVNNVHVGAGAQASRTRRPLEGRGSARSGSARSTSASSATRSAPLLSAFKPP